jgi:single-strand DNA-binding protein
VIAVGHVYTSEYEDRDGNRRSNLEMRATSVGPDLSRSIVRIIEKTGSGRDAAASAEEPVVEVGDAADAAESEDAAVGGEALSLSA